MRENGVITKYPITKMGKSWGGTDLDGKTPKIPLRMWLERAAKHSSEAVCGLFKTHSKSFYKPSYKDYQIKKIYHAFLQIKFHIKFMSRQSEVLMNT
jgi:hypothetical protein